MASCPPVGLAVGNSSSVSQSSITARTSPRLARRGNGQSRGRSAVLSLGIGSSRLPYWEETGECQKLLCYSSPRRKLAIARWRRSGCIRRLEDEARRGRHGTPGSGCRFQTRSPDSRSARTFAAAGSRTPCRTLLVLSLRHPLSVHVAPQIKHSKTSGRLSATRKANIPGHPQRTIGGIGQLQAAFLNFLTHSGSMQLP